MKTSTPQSERPTDGANLPELEALQQAIYDALLALGDGSLEQLEDSLCRQQLLCATLQHSLDQLRKQAVDPATLQRTLLAMQGLKTLSQTYSSAIEQANDSTELLLRLLLPYQTSNTLRATSETKAHGRLSLCMA